LSGDYNITNFIILIFCLACICFGFAGISVLIGTAYFEPTKHEYLLSFISALGSSMGGAAGFIAAGAALLGVNTWKKQLKYGKHISLVWRCMESLRNFHQRKMLWYILVYADGTHQHISEEKLNIERKLLNAELEELSRSFNSLDKIVVKNKWQWANYVGGLEINICNIAKTLSEHKENQIGIVPLNQKLVEINKSLTANIEFLDSELEKLESEYL
jgi:hypothetical protein